MFRSKLWLCLFHALQLSCLIGISSPLAKFKYNQKGIIKKVMVVFEIIIRVTNIYKGFFKTLKIMSLCCSLYQSNAFKIWQMANLINIHPRPVVRSSNGSLCSEIPGKKKMINSIFFFQNETSSRSASGANLKIMSLQGGGGLTPQDTHEFG